MTKHQRRPHQRRPHQRRPQRRRHLGITLATGFAIAACSSGNQVTDLTTVPAASATAATPTTERDVSTTVVETTTSAPNAATASPNATTAPTSTETDDGDDGSNGVTGPRFSDALGTKVESAPGVNTRGDTRQLLPEGLYVHIAWEPDPNDPSVFTVQPDDIAILEAYANAVTTYYRAATTTVTTDDPDFAKYILDAEAMFSAAFENARKGNFVLDLGTGVVLRPYVVDGSADQVVVYDCYLQDEAYVVREQKRDPTEVTQRGQVATMQRIDGGWKVATSGSLGSACL